MLTRIAVVGDDDQFFAQVQGAAEGKDVQLKPVHPDGSLPPGTAAVIGPSSVPGLVAVTAASLGAAHEAVLVFLADAIDAREGLLPGSAKRLMEHARRFAQALGLTQDDRSAFVRGAILHDIGKLRISNEVLLKKSVLDYDDWLLLRDHPKLGADLLVEAGIHTDTLDVVRHHHECFDGTGYPGGLEGEAIPYLARAMKIVDVYCAMTSPRHYRTQVHSHDTVIANFREESGKHYDPELVDAFIAEKVGKAWAS